MKKISVEHEIDRAKSHEKKGEIIEARNIYKGVLKVFPKNLRVQKKLAELDTSEKNSPMHPPQEFINRIIKLINQKQLSSVIDMARALTRQYPKSFIAWDLLGATNKLLGNFEEALKNFKKAIEINPDYENAYYNMGVVLLDNYDKPKEAIDSFRKCLSLNSQNAAAHNNIGNSLRSLGRLKEAIYALNKSTLIEPNNAVYYSNTGNVLRDLGEFNKAIETYNKAILLKPDYAEAYYNLSFTYNLRGDLKKGLELYEWRMKKNSLTTRIPRKHLTWDKHKPISGKKFFVYEEQGLGDTIQFCRYLSLLKQNNVQVVFKVKTKMHALLKTLDENIILIDSELDDNTIDFETPLMSLPYLFNTNINTIPSLTSYLSADHEKVKFWKKRLTKDTFKVGICWQGSTNKAAFGRSFPLTLFKDISKLPNVELISLHKGEGEKQIEDINFDLTVLGNDFDSGEDAFVDTAAVISNCDLVITCDTAIAHLAGALGCHTWVVLKKIPDWRWMLDRNDSPWYPNVKLYRQKKYDNWEEVFKTIKKDLQSFIKLNEN